MAIGVSCPGGSTTREYTEKKEGGRVFTFGPECRRCPLRHKCVQNGKAGASRTVQIHSQEALLAAAREYPPSTEGQATLRQRVAVEHALARLTALRVGQARYFGRAKTSWQWYLSAAVANFRSTENWRCRPRSQPPDGVPEATGGSSRDFRAPTPRDSRTPRGRGMLSWCSARWASHGLRRWLRLLAATPF